MGEGLRTARLMPLSSIPMAPVDSIDDGEVCDRVGGRGGSLGGRPRRLSTLED
jgi:hypothetical protein